MEIKPPIEAVVRDTLAVAQFIGERLVGGAWGILANQVQEAQETRPANIQVHEAQIIRGEE